MRPDKDFWGRKEPRFGAAALSLEELLQYDEDDSKEGAFEVAAFAELFREMLEARFGRGLSRCLAAIGAKEREVCFWFAYLPYAVRIDREMRLSGDIMSI